MNLCTIDMAMRWIVFVYMAMACGLPFAGISIIFFVIARYTRRTHAITIATRNSGAIRKRDLRVLRRMMTLVCILGTAGVPSVVLLIWNYFFAQSAPIPLYLASTLTISFCTNIQISFIFVTNKRVCHFLRLRFRDRCC